MGTQKLGDPIFSCLSCVSWFQSSVPAFVFLSPNSRDWRANPNPCLSVSIRGSICMDTAVMSLGFPAIRKLNRSRLRIYP